MKNIHVIPTQKPSRLHLIEDTLTITNEYKNSVCDAEVNIYITNDEKIKEGDWCIDKHNFVYKQETDKIFSEFTGSKKIILTTDQDLIKDHVQVIDDEFLEWFIKNPSCEEVEVKTRYLHYYKTGETFISLSKTPEFSSRNMQCIKIEPRYEIIIPKEEPKQETHICRYCKAETTQSDDECYAKPKQETLEEDDLKIPSKFCIPHKHYISDDDKICYETGYKDGIKWQQERMYSEKEVESLLHKYMQSQIPDWHGWSTTKWFEQFKKK